MTLKIFVIKIATVYAFFILLLGFVGGIFELTTFPPKKEVDEKLKLGTKYYYFGSSVNHSIAAADTDRRSISEIIHDNLGGQNVCDISHEAYHLSLYEKFYSYILRNKLTDSVVSVIEINLRSFSPEWQNRPSYQFEKEKYILQKETTLPGFFGRLNYYPLTFISHETSQKEFNSTVIRLGDDSIGTMADLLREESLPVSDSIISRRIILHYLYTLDSSSARIVSLRTMLDLAQKRHQRIILYITPIDYMEGKEHLGAVFSDQLKKNISLLQRIAHEYRTPVLELSNMLTHEYFDYLHFPNEHMNQEGRRAVADAICQYIKTSIPEP